MLKRFFVVIFIAIAVLANAFTIVDDAGRLVELDDLPKRAVIGAPAVTDFLLYLDLDEKIVGVTNWDEYVQVSDVETIGNLVPINIEKILTLEPDIVFLTGGFQEAEADKLTKYGLNVVVINPKTFEEIYRDIVQIAAIFGESKKGKTLADNFKQNYLDIAKKTHSIPNEQKPKVLYTMITGEMKEIWTCGTGSFINQVITYAGGVNVAAPYTGNNGWFPINAEFVLKNNPEIILVPYYSNEKKTVELIKNYPPFENVKAVANDNVYGVPDRMVAHADPESIKLLKLLYSLFYEND
ncbi:MAG: ABC transporter substrate-binding protein [Kosmotoga sp.]|nr:MAG: ABC transporter substrate-binding protein [Kosmotoga sp.]